MTELLRFCANGIKYALPLDLVQSTIRMVAVDDQNGSVINVHGRAIPVARIRIQPQKERPVRASDCFIITTLGENGIALFADIVEGIGTFEETRPGDIPGTRVAKDDLIIIDDISHVPLSYDIQPPEDKETQDILARRADAIAMPEESGDDITYPEILRFSLGYVEYAVFMQYVREVILTGEITPIPGIPRFITGISVVRGRIISLVDLRKFFGMPEIGLTDFNRVIILSDGKMTFGLLVDRILGTSRVKTPDLRTGTENVIPESHLVGISRGVIIIDAKALLTDERMIINEQEQATNVQAM